MNCVNCERDAVWIFKTSGVRPTPYCNPHLPAAYRGSSHVTPADFTPAATPEPDGAPTPGQDAREPVAVPRKTRTRKAATPSLIAEIDADPERKPLLDAARAELAAESAEA